MTFLKKKWSSNVIRLKAKRNILKAMCLTLSELLSVFKAMNGKELDYHIYYVDQPSDVSIWKNLYDLTHCYLFEEYLSSNHSVKTKICIEEVYFLKYYFESHLIYE